MLSPHSLIAGAVILAGGVVARTDLEGCTYYDSVVRDGNGPGYATRVWYVPDSGEICEFLDCGGGRAPPKTTVPGCGFYSGTDTYSPNFLNLKTIPGAAPETTAAVTTTLSSAASTPQTTSAATVETGKASASETGTETAAATTPQVSNSGSAQVTTGSGSATTTLLVSTGAATNGTATTGVTSSTPTNAGAMPTAQALLAGGCLAAGIAACAGLL